MVKRYIAAAAALCLATGAQAATIDFEDFSAGDAVNAVSAGGVNARVRTRSNGSVDQALVFDTLNYSGGDRDLQGPFTDDNGGADLVAGNALIIQENMDFSDPDDEARGGTITFIFDQMITFLGFDALDDIRVTVRSDQGDRDRLRVSSDNHYATANYSWENVTRLSFRFSGSGAIDNLRIEPTVAQVPVPASLPLLLGALGGFGYMARRRKG